MKPAALSRTHLAQPDVKNILVSLGRFLQQQRRGRKRCPASTKPGLAVTPSGAPTPRRALWQFTTRYLSGGALG